MEAYLSYRLVVNCEVTIVSGSSLYKIYNMKLFNNSIYLIIRLFYTYMYIPSCRSVAPDLKNFGLMTPSSSIRFISQTGSYRPAAEQEICSSLLSVLLKFYIILWSKKASYNMKRLLVHWNFILIKSIIRQLLPIDKLRI